MIFYYNSYLVRGYIMEYIKKLQQAINYVEENLKEDLKLEKIAQQCYFSVPHFYRLFQIFTGYSIMDYVRKRRLSQAAHELLTTNKRLIDISFDYNFESQEAFIRAFRKLFGITPGEYRKSYNGIGLFSKLNIGEYNFSSYNRNIVLDPEFIEKQLRLVGVEGEINFNEDFTKTIIALQEKLISNLTKIYDLIIPERYVAYWYYKWDANNPNQEPAVYYFAATEVKDISNIEGLITKIIPKSMYAAFNETHRGEVGGPDGYAYKVWLPAAGKDLNEAIPGDFEIYNDIKDIGPNSSCKIYIPIMKL